MGVVSLLTSWARVSEAHLPCCKRWCWTSRWSALARWLRPLDATVGARTPRRPRQTLCANRRGRICLSAARTSQKIDLFSYFFLYIHTNINIHICVWFPRLLRYTHNVPGGLCIVGSQILHVWRKPFVQPQVVPPLHCHQVAKPLQIWKD